MMEDFHDSAQRAGGAFDVAASVEAEARATGRDGGGGLVGCDDSTGPDRSGGRHVGLDDSTGSHRGATCWAR
jgi:hypothetical protein